MPCDINDLSCLFAIYLTNSIYKFVPDSMVPANITLAIPTDHSLPLGMPAGIQIKRNLFSRCVGK